MVAKIQNDEYLLRVDNMSAAERNNYLKRVDAWLAEQAPLLEPTLNDGMARLQNVIQYSAGWNDQVCKAWEEGARLLSALFATGETWLPDMLYVKSVKRCIGRMVLLLKAVHDGDAIAAAVPQPTEKGPAAEHTEGWNHTADVGGTQAVASFQGSADNGDIAGGDKDGEARVKAASKREQDGAGSGSAEREQPRPEVKAVPQRPKHTDQYVHLLPAKTQERAATVRGLLRDLDTAREKMNLLMDDPKASDDSRASWAKTATKLDEKVKTIYRELDAEWAKLVQAGKVTVDDLGNARVIPSPGLTPSPSIPSEARPPVAFPKGEGSLKGEGSEQAEESETGVTELTSEQRARRRDLRKWLVDTRRGNGASRDEHVAKWKESFREFAAIEGDKAYDDKKLIEAADYYGINLEELKS